jgi:hypothetical protein
LILKGNWVYGGVTIQNFRGPFGPALGGVTNRREHGTAHGQHRAVNTEHQPKRFHFSSGVASSTLKRDRMASFSNVSELFLELQTSIAAQPAWVLVIISLGGLLLLYSACCVSVEYATRTSMPRCDSRPLRFAQGSRESKQAYVAAPSLFDINKRVHGVNERSAAYTEMHNQGEVFPCGWCTGAFAALISSKLCCNNRSKRVR